MVPGRSSSASPGKTRSLRDHERTVMDAFNSSSFYRKDPEIVFGTSVRQPRLSGTLTPGPGAYPLKSTLFKQFDSQIQNPPEFSLKSRQKFGDPYLRALDKTMASEPGPGHYNTLGKFPRGRNPRQTGFPKAGVPRDKAALGPG